MSEKRGKPEDFGCVVIDHYSKGTQTKETRIPAGVRLGQEVHEFDHQSICGKGRAKLFINDAVRFVEAGECINIEAGKVHQVQAITDVIWFCIWPDNIEALES